MVSQEFVTAPGNCEWSYWEVSEAVSGRFDKYFRGFQEAFKEVSGLLAEFKGDL